MEEIWSMWQKENLIIIENTLDGYEEVDGLQGWFGLSLVEFDPRCLTIGLSESQLGFH